ncbi:RimJ/RimL family protein N-acetyltransferase [Bradyrhizobium embrapense]
MNIRGFETKRLVVRPLRSDDRATCVRTARDSVLPRLQRDGDLLTLSQLDADLFRTMIRRRAKWAASDQLYLISAFLREDGSFIGDTMLFDVFRDQYPRAEIGTVIASPFHGLGIGTELIAGTLAWGWNELGLEEIKGFIEDGNAHSTVACLRSGFSLTTSRPISRCFQGELRWGWPIVARRPQ